MLGRRRKNQTVPAGEGQPPITVKVVPASGSSREIPVKLAGASLGDVLREAGVRRGNMQASINGDPSNDDRHHVPVGATVTLTERARGS